MKKIKNIFSKLGNFKNCIKAFGFVLLIMSLLLVICDYVPFGNNSFATSDANIQYIDFFSYLKNVFEGNDSIKYSFNNTLGGATIGIVSYYLLSPLNWLVIFFDQSNLHLFFNIIVILKLAICAFTFSYYLEMRFNKKIKPIFNIILSASFSLMQYNLLQTSNIMWLDGVYMLPLIALGIYKLINNKQIHLLSVSVGLSIIFNWYTGGINCIFSIFLFLLEYIIYFFCADKKDIKTNIIYFIKSGLLYVLSMIIGVMLSAVVFFPTVLALRSGSGSSFDWNSLTLNFRGNIISTIQKYCIGSQSEISSLTIFCGSIPLIGVLGYFTDDKVKYKNKILLGVVLLISIMFCYWQPMYFLFSLFKVASSYYFRYSYIVNFIFIFIAANYYKNIQDKKENKNVVYASITFSFILFLLHYINNIYDYKYLYATVFFVFANLILIILLKKFNNKKIVNIFLIICVALELGINSKVLMNSIKFDSVDKYSLYVSGQNKQIEEIKNKDKEQYRISQTKTRFMGEDRITAFYNDSLAYGYMSNASYTSAPVSSQLTLLDRLGYKDEAGKITIVNTSILPTDSLLGVKYVLADYDIKGLKRLEEYQESDGKYVYLNPYALPLAFKYQGKQEAIIEYTNEFEYTNSLYSQIYGSDVKLYEKAKFNKKISDDEKNITYEINVPKGNFALYGKITYSDTIRKQLEVNNQYYTSYNSWLTPSVFYVPTEEVGTAYVKVTSDQKINSEKSEEYYILNLDELEKVSSKINKNSVEEIILTDGMVKCNISTDEKDERLFLSIPNSDGWNIKVNGEIIKAEEFANCFITIPLDKGENEVILTYNMPGLIMGVITSILGIALLLFVKGRLKKINIK